jgi:hypothetical protein
MDGERGDFCTGFAKPTRMNVSLSALFLRRQNNVYPDPASKRNALRLAKRQISTIVVHCSIMER